uniref:Uncharacterized protein n=1 Tax=Arundo donax TaxID=35708 RepID=A0A0A8Z8K2_ARUDO
MLTEQDMHSMIFEVDSYIELLKK